MKQNIVKWGFYWGEYKNNNMNKRIFGTFGNVPKHHGMSLVGGTREETMNMNVLWPLSKGVIMKILLREQCHLIIVH